MTDNEARECFDFCSCLNEACCGFDVAPDWNASWRQVHGGTAYPGRVSLVATETDEVRVQLDRGGGR